MVKGGLQEMRAWSHLEQMLFLVVLSAEEQAAYEVEFAATRGRVITMERPGFGGREGIGGNSSGR